MFDQLRTIDKLTSNAKILLVIQSLLQASSILRGKDISELCDTLMYEIETMSTRKQEYRDNA